MTRFPLRDINQVVPYEFILPPTMGDLSIEFDSDLYSPSSDDPRKLGVALDWVEIQSLRTNPPLTTTVLLLLLVTLLWWFGLRVGLSSAQAALLPGALLVCLLAGLIGTRLLITVGLSRWVVTALLLHLLLWPAQQLMGRVMRRHDLEISPTGWRWLWGIFGLALLFKLGGALYPQAIFFDQAAHTKRVHMLLNGQFADLYFPGFTSYMGVTVGLESGFMPYSPLWYLIIAPLHGLGITVGDAMNGLNALLDVSKGLLVFLITFVTLRRERAALLASALYPLFPMPYFLISWGNYPTQFGLWAALLAITFLALNYEHMPMPRQWRSFGLWVVLLLLVILSYTMIGLMTFTMFGILMLIKVFQGIKPNRHLIVALVAGMLLAESIAFMAYHIHFAPVFLQSTVPSIASSVVDKTNAELRSDMEARESPLSNFMANNSFMRNHATDQLLLLALIGIVWLYVDRKAGRYRALWSAWLAIFAFYTLVSAYIADMVLKHVFFVMPLICIGIALVLDTIWSRWRFGKWLVLIGLITLFMLVLDRWWFYLLIKRHY